MDEPGTCLASVVHTLEKTENIKLNRLSVSGLLTKIIIQQCPVHVYELLFVLIIHYDLHTVRQSSKAIKDQKSLLRWLNDIIMF